MIRRAPWLAALLVTACAGGAMSLPVDTLSAADIIILGEVHDNPKHHENQAALIRELGPSAVAFEMLTPEQAAIANETTARDNSLRDALDWDTSGWPNWSLYQPVFDAVGSTPIYGMALPAESVNRAVREGAAAVFGEDASRFGLTRPPTDAQQRARESHQQASHCNMLPESLLPGMVEAQRLRDAAFARVTLQALEDTGGPVVVITGSGHARTDWGMPAVLLAATSGVSVASLGQFEEEPDGPVPFDTWLVADPAPREDPCAAFAATRKPS